MPDLAFPTIVRPADSRRCPIVVSIPHSGTQIPEQEREWYAVDIDELARGGDPYVDELYRGVEMFGATVISTPYNRFVIDMNRLPDDFSPLSVVGTRVRRNPGYYGHRGLIWAVTSEGRPIYRRPLPRSVVQRRLDDFYHPYHASLSAELKSLRDEFGFAILIDAHSMPSRGTGAAHGYTSRRADIVPGDLMGRSCGRWLSDAVVDYWASAGRSVSRNRPYRGGAITRRHHLPSRGVHAIQIELNRDLYLDEATGERVASFHDLRADCLRFIAHISQLAPPDVSSAAAE